MSASIRVGSLEHLEGARGRPTRRGNLDAQVGSDAAVGGMLERPRPLFPRVRCPLFPAGFFATCLPLAPPARGYGDLVMHGLVNREDVDQVAIWQGRDREVTDLVYRRETVRPGTPASEVSRRAFTLQWVAVALAIVALVGWHRSGERGNQISDLNQRIIKQDADDLRLQSAVCLAHADEEVEFELESALRVPSELAGFGCGVLTDKDPAGLVPASYVPLWPEDRS